MALAGSLNVLLGMDTAGFSAGAKKAQSELASFSGGISQTLFSGMSGGAVSTAFDIGISAVGKLKDGVVDTGKAFAAMVADAISSMGETSDLADELGIPIQQLSELQYAFRLTHEPIDKVNSSIEKFALTLGKATLEGGKSAKAFQRIGLNVDDLNKKDVGAALRETLMAIRKLPTEVERYAAAVSVAGKSAGSFMDVINSEKDLLSQASLEARQFGISISEVDKVKLDAARDEMTRVGEAITGIKNRVAIELTPHIAFSAKQFADWAANGRSAAQVVADGFDSVARWSLAMADGVDYVGIRVRGMAFEFVDANRQIVHALATADKARVDLVGGRRIKELSDADNALTSQAQNLKESLTGFWGDGLREYFRGVHLESKLIELAAKNAQNNLGRVNDELGEQISQVEKLVDTWQLGVDAAKVVKELQASGLALSDAHLTDIAEAKLKGGLPEQIAQLQSLASELESIDEIKKQSAEWDQKAKSLLTEAISPLETYSQKLGDINRAWQQGMLTAEKYWKLVGKAQEEFNKSNPVKEFAKKTLEATKTPLEKFREEIAKIREAWQAGELDQGHTALAVLNARKELAEATAKEIPFTGNNRPGAFEHGSAAAFSASFAEVAKPAEKSLEIQKQIERWMRKVEENTANIGGNFAIDP